MTYYQVCMHWALVPMASCNAALASSIRCCPIISPCMPSHIGWSAGVGNLCSGHYIYTADLLEMEATATGQWPLTFRPASPLVPAAWEQVLSSHPDRSFVDYIPTGIRVGFHIGADRRALSLWPGPGNFPSVCQHHQVVEAHIDAEVAAHRLIGPVPDSLASLCHCSPIRLIPKPHQPGRWRLIVDLLAPHGSSV